MEAEEESQIDEVQSRIPLEGRLAGIDFGTVRIGISICDPSQTWVTPLETYTVQGAQKDAEYFVKLAASNSLAGFVVGLPLHCDGNESQKSAEVRQFSKWLGNSTGLAVSLFDERFTTAEARRLLDQRPGSGKKKKAKLDGVAAHLILSHFLESQRRESRSLDSPHDGSPNSALDDQ